MSTASFAAGFVAGWLVRTTVESSRALVVDLLAFGLDVTRRARRAFIAERELLEDLWAEAKARASADENAEEEMESADGESSVHPSVREAAHVDGGAPS